MESRSRAPNWTTAEIVQIVEGHFDAGETNRSIEEICARVNAVGGNERSIQDVKDKWTYLKSETKTKERRRRRFAEGTGAGPAPKALRPWEEKILQFLPKVVLDGLDEGTDTFRDSSTSKNKVEATESSISDSSTSKNKVQVTPVVPDVTRVVPEAVDTSTSTESSISDPVQQTNVLKKKINRSKAKCDCDERVIGIEQEKLEENRKIRRTLESIDITLRSILEVKRRKLDLMEGNALIERSNLFDSLA